MPNKKKARAQSQTSNKEKLYGKTKIHGVYKTISQNLQRPGRCHHRHDLRIQGNAGNQLPDLQRLCRARSGGPLHIRGSCLPDP